LLFSPKIPPLVPMYISLPCANMGILLWGTMLERGGAPLPSSEQQLDITHQLMYSK
jgi:hypothetical protein